MKNWFGILFGVLILISGCTLTSQSQTKTNPQSCADKVAAAFASSVVVRGAWGCFDKSYQDTIISTVHVNSDETIASHVTWGPYTVKSCGPLETMNKVFNYTDNSHLVAIYNYYHDPLDFLLMYFRIDKNSYLVNDLHVSSEKTCKDQFLGG